ncbi:hypothetical protein [Acinetobacter chinensis]|uniref:hypothetical protein n=1 Tax=Acinetobacter chinensis TaxID=2004650 RepID=UPI002934B9BD|nr:hypothetical protein [Acinetobacter chinensis]WOE40674.1 hypothetical protein QSG87_12370 [Acinetobacter chinensis]
MKFHTQLLNGLRSSDEEQERIIDVTPTQETVVISNSDFKNIKSQILKAKSLDELEELESSIYALSDESDRNELIKIYRASLEKYMVTDVEVTASVKVAESKKPEPEKEEPKTRTRQTKAVEVKQQPANDQNATSNDFAKETPENVIATSTDLKKVYIKQINAADDAQQMKQIRSAVENEPKLTDGHKSYLIEHIKNSMSKFENAADEQSEEDGPNVLNSQYTAKTLKLSIDQAQNISSLEKIGQEIRVSKPKLTQDDLNAVLDTYAKRKKYLESQISMFDVSFVDAAIARINEANTQDEINVEFLDPAYEELSDAEKQQINDAAQQRESELQQ